jgi:hypothetical protein
MIWEEKYERVCGLPVPTCHDTDTHHLEAHQRLLIEGTHVHNDPTSAVSSGRRHCYRSRSRSCRIWNRSWSMSGIAIQ